MSQKRIRLLTVGRKRRPRKAFRVKAKANLVAIDFQMGTNGLNKDLGVV